jgi:methionyl-tRNA formyltransferase
LNKLINQVYRNLDKPGLSIYYQFMKPKIIFIGTPEFGAIILEELIKAKLAPILVITAPDKPVGRKQTITPPPVKLIAQKYNIPIIQKLEIKEKVDLIIVAAYGKIISKEILDIPKFGCLNVHPSLLPKYRGASPIQTAILNGDEKTGVTIMLMDEKMDHGPILASREYPMTNDQYPKIHNDLARLGADLLIETIPKYINKEIKAKEQDHTKATFTKIIKKEDGQADWSKTPQEIERQIRAFSPWPSTFTFVKKDAKQIRVKVLEVEIKDNKLVIKKVQPEGKNAMNYQEYLKGYPKL